MTNIRIRLLQLVVACLIIGIPKLSFGQMETPIPGAAGGGWTYEARLEGVRAVARTVGLYAERPEDLIREPDYEGSHRRYAQVRYGSENSRRVIVVVDDRGDGEFNLYVDLDRDRLITKQERIEGRGKERRVELASEIIEGDLPHQFPRSVLIRLGATGDRLSVATLGGIVGKVAIANPEGGPVLVAAERIDGDANGLYADSRDRLRIDLNQDRAIDPVAEQFTWLPVMTLAGRRYAIKADRQGESMVLDEIVGTGFLRVIVGKLPEKAKIIAFEAMVFSDDACAWSLKEPNKRQEVPVGRYALGSVTLTIDTADGEPWHFVFSGNQSLESKDWLDVTANSDVSLEAIGRTSLVLNCSKDRARLGEKLEISPRLYTESGLLVNLCCRGRQIGSFDNARYHNPCEVRLVNQASETLSSARSGFA